MLLKSKQRLAQECERRIADRIGGVTTKASGSLGDKADVKVLRFARVECKSTQAKSFSVSRDLIEKLELQAAQLGELPALTVHFLDGERVVKEVAVVPIWVLDRMEELSDG